MLKVCKFGGSSMADAGQLKKVQGIVEADPGRRVVVVSAAGKRFKEDHKLTDLLYLCHAHHKYGVSCDGVFEMIAERYREIKRDLNLSVDVDGELAAIREKIENGISEDELVSRGEYFAALLMADLLGYEFVDSVRWLKFKFDGSIDQDASYEALSAIATDKRVVIPGFYGAMPDGKIKTLTRGGSDITGALAAAALNADVYENWTDVSGILMADPRIVDNPKPIEHVTYDELRELSYIGAQVLHEGTIFPVREKNIPLNIRNTNDPSHPGTLIQESFAESAEENNNFITGIAGRKNFYMINLSKTGMSSGVGNFTKIFGIFDRYGISVEYAPSGIDSISLVVDGSKVSSCLYSILSELQQEINPNSISVTENISVIAAVGRKMASRKGTSGEIFATLGKNGINIRMISQGAQELNIIVGVDDKDFANTVRVLYDSFVK